MRRAWLSFLVVLPLAGSSVGACGGSAFESGPGAGGSAGTTTTSGGSTASAGTSSGTAGHATGGSLGIAGTTSVGGSAAGGTGNVAGTTSTGGSGGADLAACTSNTDCVVEPVSCCSCGTGPVSNYTAINSMYSTQYQQRCGGLVCGACPPVAFDPNDPVLYYVPTCDAGRCKVVDLRTTELTQCSTAADCSLRGGMACCASCTGQPVSLNTGHEQELSKYVCGSQPSTCPGCPSSGFPDYTTGCTDGRCSVLLAPCTVQHPCPL